MSLFKKIAETPSGRSESLKKLQEDAELRRARKTRTAIVVPKLKDQVSIVNSNQK